MTDHLDPDRVPAVTGQIEGVAAGAAAQIKGASGRPPVRALDELHQPVVGRIGEQGREAQPVSHDAGKPHHDIPHEPFHIRYVDTYQVT